MSTKEIATAERNMHDQQARAERWIVWGSAALLVTSGLVTSAVRHMWPAEVWRDGPARAMNMMLATIVLSLAAVLVSNFTSAASFADTIRRLRNDDDGDYEVAHKYYQRAVRWDVLTSICNVASIVAFVFGMLYAARYFSMLASGPS